ncbi:2-C-methyl-D-erythritol 4-phosphate cytidylyltransferase [uncultured Ramlibacter sp.]|uniref:IspD/TarI family cytidylyltransferase n=1 Tax=uncultured Ramlibacter sp. TaxID=260755 RepID=UPI0026393989|nr:2-C-methyl-D-erythritol 4-phosphate cytidylyltransferase [uncultured Ramlibacter sp.]
MNAPPRDQVSVLVPAAGAGDRLGRGPKALLMLDGRTVLEWVADKALLLGEEVILACVPQAPTLAGCLQIAGGPSRQDSVLRLARASSRPWVLVWDAARPFGSVALARAVLAQAQGSGAAGAWLDAPAPGAAAGFQTPLAFQRTLLLEVLARAEREDWQAASTMELVQRAGHRPLAVPGETSNIKLTMAQDWELAARLLHLLAPDPAASRCASGHGP